jgi:hypothetical protein
MALTNDELEGRLLVIELFSTMAIGLFLANARNDPDYSKAQSIFVALGDAVDHQAQGLSPIAAKAARDLAKSLISNLAQEIRSLRGEGGKSH